MSYFISKILFLSLIIGITCLQTKNPRNSRRNRKQSLKYALEKHSVVPDVINTIPSALIKISYANGVTVNLGNELTPTSVKNEPKLEWPVEDGVLYTLAFVDPDAPSRQKPDSREFKHWLVINIPGLQINFGQTLAEYIGSGPPKGTGLHRYVFLVYKQQKRIETSEKTVNNRSIDERGSFKIRDFAKEHNLGQPIAANFYQAQYDDYVLILHAQLNAGR